MSWQGFATGLVAGQVGYWKEEDIKKCKDGQLEKYMGEIRDLMVGLSQFRGLMERYRINKIIKDIKAKGKYEEFSECIGDFNTGKIEAEIFKYKISIVRTIILIIIVLIIIIIIIIVWYNSRKSSTPKI